MSAVQNTNQAPAGKPGLGMIFMLSMLLAVALAGGAAWSLGWLPVGASAQAEVTPPPLYYTLDPNLIVNFEGGGRVRYLQLGIELMTRDEKAREAIELHAPVLRNNLIMLLSDQTYDELLTRDGKEALREAALAEVQAVMTERFGAPGIETLYFTSFVMQ